MKPKLIIVGAGGHGRVVYDAVIKQGLYSVTGFADAALEVGTIVIGDCKVIISQNELLDKGLQDHSFVIAIGNNEVRKSLFEVLAVKHSPATIIHPAAIIANDVKIDDGCVILAGSVINTGSTIGQNTIVNSFSLVDHDVSIGSHVHIERGSILMPGCRLNETVQTEPGKVYPAFTHIQQ